MRKRLSRRPGCGTRVIRVGPEVALEVEVGARRLMLRISRIFLNMFFECQVDGGCVNSASDCDSLMPRAHSVDVAFLYQT